MPIPKGQRLPIALLIGPVIGTWTSVVRQSAQVVHSTEKRRMGFHRECDDDGPPWQFSTQALSIQSSFLE